jgi:hypothetical protein
VPLIDPVRARLTRLQLARGRPMTNTTPRCTTSRCRSGSGMPSKVSNRRNRARPPVAGHTSLFVLADDDENLVALSRRVDWVCVSRLIRSVSDC